MFNELLVLGLFRFRYQGKRKCLGFQRKRKEVISEVTRAVGVSLLASDSPHWVLRRSCNCREGKDALLRIKGQPPICQTRGMKRVRSGEEVRGG
jgi:hypothetical protein